MANILDRFKKNVIGSGSSINDYTAVITPSGDFKRISGFTAILNSWNNILLTPVGSYDHDPEYGSNIHKFVFEPLDSKTSEKIKKEIKRCVSNYTNGASISRIDVKFLSGGKGFSADIFVDYEDEQGRLSINMDEAKAFNIL